MQKLSVDVKHTALKVPQGEETEDKLKSNSENKAVIQISIGIF